MEDNKKIEFEEEGLSLSDLLQIVKRHILSIIVLVGLFFSLMLFYSFKIQTPIYKSLTTVMVNTTTSSGSSANNDYIYAQRIISTYEIFIKSNLVLNQVSANLAEGKEVDPEVYGQSSFRLDYSPSELKGMIETGILSGSATNSDSLILAIQVSGLNPYHCSIIANEIVEVAQTIPQTGGNFSILKSSTLDQVDIATPNLNYDKNLVKNSVIGIVLGCIVAAGYIIIREVLDTTVSDVKVLEQTLGLNVLTIVPDAEDKKAKARV